MIKNNFGYFYKNKWGVGVGCMAEVFVDPAFHLTALTFGFNKLKVQYPEGCVWGSNFLGRCVQGHLVLVGVFCCFGFGGGVWFFEGFFCPFVCLFWVFLICAIRESACSLWETK